MRQRTRRGLGAVAGSMIVVLVLTGLALIAQSPASATTQVVTPTCPLVADSGTFTYSPTLTLSADAPGSVQPGKRMTVTIAAEPETLASRSAIPQWLVAYTNIQTDYAVSGGTVDPASIHLTSQATLASVAIGGTAELNGNGVRVNIPDPVRPTDVTSPGVAFDVVAASSGTVKVQAVQHKETLNYDGPGLPMSATATCAISVPLTSTAISNSVDTSSSTSTSTSTSTTSTSTSTSTSTTSTSTSTSSTTSTTFVTDPPPPGPTASIADAVVGEPVNKWAAMQFTVTLSNLTDRGSFHYQTLDGTALAGVDYVATKGTVRFNATRTTATISVQVRADKIADPNETFMVQIFDAHNVTITRDIAVGTIIGG